MYLFHGTSYSNGLKILKEGFNNSKSKIWNCSSTDKTYFYKSKSFNEGIQNALDQSLISVGIKNESKAIVFVFDSNKVKNQKPDNSCIGMKEIAVEASINSLDGLISVYESENLFFESKRALINCSINPKINMNFFERIIYNFFSKFEFLHYKKKYINFKVLNYRS